jgi:CubicO group peptidase (beta-lactamase class C family)
MSLPSPVQRYLRTYPLATLGVGVTIRGEHQVQVLGGGTPPPAGALFELGGLTQVFTGALLAVLVERGELRLDTPLSAVVPRPLLPDELAGRITLEQLATHTSGMPHAPPNLRVKPPDPADPYGHYVAEHFGAFLRGYQPSAPPPHRVVESIIGMGVLGHALSRKAGLNYGHALRDLVCKPLRLEDTTLRLSDAQQPRLLPGHDARGQPVPGWTFPALPGAGALRSTVPDLLRFLDGHLGRGDEPLVRALRLSHLPRAAARGYQLGLGWKVSRVRGQTVTWCSAVTGGYVGFLGFVEEAGVGVVLLSNHAPSRLASLLRRNPLEAPGFALLAHPAGVTESRRGPPG